MLDYINPFSDNFILKNIITSIGNILSYINPFSENFFGYKIIEMFRSLLKDLFVPSDNYFSDKISEVQNKFTFIEQISNSVNSIKELFANINNSPTLSVSLGSTKYNEKMEVNIIDLNWYAPYKQYGDMFISAFMYIFFIWRVYFNLSNTINGVSSVSYDISSIIKKF